MMPTVVGRKLHVVQMHNSALHAQIDSLSSRADRLAYLLTKARDWIYPFDERRICQFCQVSMEEPHLPGCYYRQWLDEVRDLLG